MFIGNRQPDIYLYSLIIYRSLKQILRIVENCVTTLLTDLKSHFFKNFLVYFLFL